MKMFDAGNTRMIGLPYGEKTVTYVKTFSSDTGALRTDRRTELFYQYCATRDKNDGTFLRDGWAEFHQTGSEGSQTINSTQACFRIS